MACLHQFMLNVVKINFNEYEMIEHSDDSRLCDAKDREKDVSCVDSQMLATSKRITKNVTHTHDA